MFVTQFVKRLNYALRGTDDDPPTEGTEDFEYWMETFNQKKDELFEDLEKQWRFSHRTDKTVGPITASASLAFDLDPAYLGIDKEVFVIDLDGKKHSYDVIQPQEADSTVQAVYVDSQNPEVIHFTAEILADDAIIGGTLHIPGYYMPDDIDYTADAFDPDTAVIPLPNANWGVLAVAAEVAFNDITYEDKAPDLNTKANNLYKLMAKRNRRGTYKNARKSPDGANRNRIRGRY